MEDSFVLNDMCSMNDTSKGLLYYLSAILKQILIDKHFLFYCIVVV